jgi:hypothetical protein
MCCRQTTSAVSQISEGIATLRFIQPSVFKDLDVVAALQQDRVWFQEHYRKPK